MTGYWSWSWLPKDPPQSFGDNLPFDLLRVVVVLSALWLAFTCITVIREQRRREEPFPMGQVFRFLGFGAALVYICLTEIVVFGTVATPRLFLGLFVVACGWYGLRSARIQQHKEPIERR